jgi:Xaa-Pro aminopeptidase
VRVITAGLIKLSLLKGGLDKNIREHAYRRFYMHKTGHWLGLDVHDVGDYRIDGQDRELEPGMVVTVEPGIYIAPDAKGVAAKWRGIGIRIEDDVVVTRGDPEVITAAVPSDADEIEALMAAARIKI